MKHIHLETCDSTQKYLIEMTKDNAVDDILVSCDYQAKGVGQRKNTWDCYKNTLCMSFVLIENEVLNLTSLEMGVLVCEFFDLKLKWPNDILNKEGKKVGGIIINKHGDHSPVIGMGINLYADQNEILSDYEIKAGFVFNEPKNFIKKELAEELFTYIKTHRLNSTDTISKWNNYCSHMNRSVILKDEQNIIRGTFKGIGDYGQALIEYEGQTKEYYSGTLRIDN
jgi:BirA family biotin operon repressor/biotin-[acetyl-CoA-carboxylase] ligase